MKKINSILCLFFCISALIGQDTINPHYFCGFGLNNNTRESNLINLNNLIYNRIIGVEPNAVYEIPVVFHVLYNNAEENISNEQILSQLDVLNEDFRRLNPDKANTQQPFSFVAADTKIQFCIAKQTPSGQATNGIIRTFTTKTSFLPNTEMKVLPNGDPIWDNTNYLNIWICNLDNNQNVLGYAYNSIDPLFDGIVIDYQCFGRIGNLFAPYNKGRVLTHEVGHYFSLMHTWGNGSPPSGPYNCTDDDGISDTPLQFGPIFGNPIFPHTDVCTPSFGVQFMNFMDYTFDYAKNMFSNEQGIRMRNLLISGGARRNLALSDKCNSPITNCNTPILFPDYLHLIGTDINILNNIISPTNKFKIRFRELGSVNWDYFFNSVNSTFSTQNILIPGICYEFQIAIICQTNPLIYSNYSNSHNICPPCNTIDDLEFGDDCSSIQNFSSQDSYTSFVSSFISSSTDRDYFSFDVYPTNPNILVELFCKENAPDLDIEVYSYKNELIAALSNTNPNDFNIKVGEKLYLNSLTPGKYYIKVFGYNGAFSTSTCYSLRVSPF